MRLVSARAQSYKSIADSGNVPIESDVTTLVGKNESGKSAFLEALYRINPAATDLRSRFQELYDYPRRRRNADRDQIPDIRPTNAVFELEEDDVRAVEERLGKGVLTSNRITISRNYKNIQNGSYNSDEAAVVRQFASDAHLPTSFASGIGTIDGLREALEVQEDRTELADELLQKVANFEFFEELLKVLDPRLPKFIYFDEYSTMPGRFSIPYIQNADEDDLDSHERTALAFLRLAGVDTQEFLEAEYEARRAALKAAAIQISDEVFEFWSQNRELEVDVDVDFKADNQDPQRVTPFLEIRIRNNRHRVSLNFSERSTGFVWFFSFLAYFSEVRDRNERLIILLDEPGLGLHAAAQADLLRFIDERLASALLQTIKLSIRPIRPSW